MPHKCCVSDIHTIGKSIFGVGTKNRLFIKKKWVEALGIKLKKNFRVSSSHFKDSDIVNTWVSGEESSKYTVLPI